MEWPYAAIFEGDEVYDERVWDGSCFRPKRIVKVIKLNEEV